jgi:predicted P-loop ATPase
MAKNKKDSAATNEGGEKEHKKRSAQRDALHAKNWREVYATVEDIKTYLSDHIYLRHNVITGRIECRVPTKDLWELGTDPFEAAQVDKWQPISDRIVNSLWTAMSREKPVRAQDLFRVIESDFVPDYHPFRYYLENLPEWDGETDYILGMSVSVQVKGDVEEQILFATYLKKWLVGMVAAWIDPNVVNNVILVLIGEQGSYKTTWFNYLLPPELKDYFYTKTNANRMGRDDLLTLAQYALVCCEELDTMKPAELNQLKAAVTMPSIDERAAYAHFHEHRQHIASFCGTGNNVQFLSATDILQLVGSNPVLKLTTNKIGRAMTDLGFERMRTGTERGYNVVQYSAEEIKARQRMKACDAKPETAGEDDANDTNDAFF